MLITRKDYIATSQLGNADRLRMHRCYFAQFVNDEIKEVVTETFGMVPLHMAYAQDRAFNTIAIAVWDAVVANHKKLVDPQLLARTGEGWSSATGICIFKEAAKQLVEANIM